MVDPRKQSLFFFWALCLFFFNICKFPPNWSVTFQIYRPKCKICRILTCSSWVLKPLFVNSPSPDVHGHVRREPGAFRRPKFASLIWITYGPVQLMWREISLQTLMSCTDGDTVDKTTFNLFNVHLVFFNIHFWRVGTL